MLHKRLPLVGLVADSAVACDHHPTARPRFSEPDCIRSVFLRKSFVVRDDGRARGPQRARDVQATDGAVDEDDDRCLRRRA